MQSITFYHKHLENVSRSFSFCILQLKSPAKEWVALSYLLCRIADTIEDSTWPNKQLQYDAFQQFKLFLDVRPTAAQFKLWRDSFPLQIPAVEKNLLADLLLLLNDKKELPLEIQSQLVKTLCYMIDGMLHFLNHHKKNSTLILPSLATTNQYCFFVAGVVGELLTRIYTYLITEFQFTDFLLIQSFHFGLFLQKINILKDQVNDELAGRYYIYARENLRNSIYVHAEEAMLYLKAIPIVSGRHYRLFCAWSLFIGLASLKWINKSWQINKSCKIGSRETGYIMNQVKQMIDDNHALEILFKRYLPQNKCLEECSLYLEHTSNPQKPIWFNEIYPYAFSKDDIVALGI